MKSIITQNGLSVEELSDGTFLVESFKDIFVKREQSETRKNLVRVRVYKNGRIVGDGSKVFKSDIFEALSQYTFQKLRA